MSDFIEKRSKLKQKNRRVSVDIWVYAARVLAIGSWIFFILGLILSYYAAPENDYGLLRWHNIDIRKFWLTPLTGYLYIILWLSALSSYFYLIVAHYRSRRKSDNKHTSLVLLFIITVAWVIYIMLHVA